MPQEYQRLKVVLTLGFMVGMMSCASEADLLNKRTQGDGTDDAGDQDRFAIQAAATCPTPVIAIKISDGPSNKTRAQRLQDAVNTANNLSRELCPTVQISVPSGTYDFSSVPPAVIPEEIMASAAELRRHQVFMPKLFIWRDGIQIVGNARRMPVLTYSGVGQDKFGHGRVIAMVRSEVKDTTFKYLEFRGDGSSTNWKNAAYYAHENSAAIRDPGQGGYGTYNYGLVMVGLNGGVTSASIANCKFSALNFNAVTLVGGADIADTTFTGVIPRPTNDYFLNDLLMLKDALIPHIGPSVGMGFQVGVTQVAYYGPVTVKRSTFANLTEGVTGSYANSKPGEYAWQIEDNSFSTIADHGVYLLGKMRASVLRNKFTYIHGSAIKIAGYTPKGSDPAGKLNNPSGTLVDGNRFDRVKRGAIEFSGTFNTISNNVVVTYKLSSDPGGRYDPSWTTVYSVDKWGRTVATRFVDHYPDFWFSNLGGQGGWFGHFAFNEVKNNTATAGNVTILLEQHNPYGGIAYDEQDRSIGFNRFTGSKQVIYVRSQLASRYPPVILLKDGSRALFAPLPNCPDCSPGPDGYRSDDPLAFAPNVSVNGLRHLVMRFPGQDSRYVVNANGLHDREEKLQAAGGWLPALADAPLGSSAQSVTGLEPEWFSSIFESLRSGQ